MTKERLIEAINLHSPDDKAVERVITTARDNKLIQCGAVGGCLLSVAWSNDVVTTSVGIDEVHIHDGATHRLFAHRCDDVVEWFDCTHHSDTRRQDTNRMVLSLLEQPGHD